MACNDNEFLERNVTKTEFLNKLNYELCYIPVNTTDSHTCTSSNLQSTTNRHYILKIVL